MLKPFGKLFEMQEIEPKVSLAGEFGVMLLAILLDMWTKFTQPDPVVRAIVGSVAALLAVGVAISLLFNMIWGSKFLRRFVFEREVDGVIWKKTIRGRNSPYTPRGHCPCGEEVTAAEWKPTVCKAGCHREFPTYSPYNKTKEELLAESNRDFPLSGRWTWRPLKVEIGLAMILPVILFFVVKSALRSIPKADLAPVNDSYPYLIPFLDPIENGYQLDFTLYAASKSGQVPPQPVRFSQSELFDVYAYERIKKRLGRVPRGKQSWPAIYSLAAVASKEAFHWDTDRNNTGEYDPIRLPTKFNRRMFRIDFQAENGRYHEEIYISASNGETLCEGFVSDDGGNKLRDISCP